MRSTLGRLLSKSRTRALLLSVILLLLPQNLRASPTEEPEPAAIVLEQASPAPYPGILLSFGRASKLYQRVELCEQERNLMKTHFEDSVKREQDLRQGQVAALQEALAKAESLAKREHDAKGLLFGAGIAVGVVAGIGLLWASAQVRIEVPVRE